MYKVCVIEIIVGRGQHAMVAGGSIELREPPCASTLPSDDAICMESLKAILKRTNEDTQEL